MASTTDPTSPQDASRRRAPCALWITALLIGVAGMADLLVARGQPEADVEVAGRLLEPLGKGFSDLDWRNEYRNIDRALSNVWHSNGWNDEADLFARDLAREVSAIPPWRFEERMTLVTERIADRYQFTPPQRTLFQGALLREASGFLMRNAARLLPTSQEAFRTRSLRKPFTAEQVARWAKESEPVMQDVRETVERFVDTLQPALSPDQRRILQRDVSSYARRRETLDKTLELWARGKWEPEHWGLQDDPIQNGTAEAQREPEQRPVPAPPPRKDTESARHPERSPRGLVSMPGRWLDYDPSTWIAYVLEFEDKYELDPGQISTAKSIHEELLERAESYVSSRRDMLEAVPPAERATHDAYAYIRETFVELTDRMASIPTTAQRIAADSKPPAGPDRPRNER